MNYPIWEVPSGGLLIALVSIVHVVVSHFAVGGGLFLVLTEHRARKQGDQALLDYLERHSRFFILLTLVFGALTGVGIWFSIALVHPQATSSLINTFVWGWAIEWTFFVAEIAAAMVYYYGWRRLAPGTHLAVGWIYFGSAWMSLVIINGIITYMMTPGTWITARSFWGAFFNETYWPSLVMRTFVCFGLAGIYALLTASRSRDPEFKARMARYAGLGWVLPMALAVPLSLIWYLSAAASAGVPTAEILGADGTGLPATLRALFGATGQTGYPVAQHAAYGAVMGSLGVIALTLLVLTVRRRSYGLPLTGLMLLLALVAMGSGEWVREDLRKPYVIGGFMFVNGVRLPAPEGAPLPPPEAAAQAVDPFALDSLRRDGILAHARWSTLPDAPPEPDAGAAADHQAALGREIFKLSCSMCHTIDGYQAIRPLVAGRTVAGLDRTVTMLARPVDAAGNETSWRDPNLRLATWRGRRMPPFPGTDSERRALAVYLARLGGDAGAGLEPATPASPGSLGMRVAEESCLQCHAADGDWPLSGMVKGRDAATLYEIIGRLTEINDAMPAFEGSDEERRALADYMAGLAAGEEQP